MYENDNLGEIPQQIRHDVSRRTIRKQKREIKNLRKSLIIMIVISIAVISAFAYCLIKYVIPYKNALDETMQKYEEIKDKYDRVSDSYDKVYREYSKLSTRVSDYENMINDLYAISATIDEQNKSLVKSNDEYFQMIKLYEERDELFDKYEYSIIRYNGTRTDITYDQLLSLELLMAEKGIDIDLILSIVMVESEGTQNATSTRSTARGYGQFLEETAEFVYEELMGMNTYSHTMAYNGDLNLEMMVYYLDHLDKIHNGDLYKMIKNYRGKDGAILDDYISRIDSYLKYNNKSVSLLNSQ